MDVLTCPKCRGQMHQYERNGVIIDQCSDCRGIFLDRGELERLAEAESRWAERTYAAPAPQQQDYEPRRQDYEPRRQNYESEDYRRRPHKRKKGWIEELFD
jgi:hypothetical protein